MNKIDLTVPQIISGDVRVLVRNNNDVKWKLRYLFLITIDPYYRCWDCGDTAKENKFDISKSSFWDQCKHIPEKRTRLMTRKECLGFIMHLKEPILVCSKNPIESESSLDNPKWYYPPTYFGYSEERIERLYYRHIDDKGNFTSEPKRFEIKEEVKDD